MNPDLKVAKWLTAASWDRIMLRLELPQWYGTQYVRKSGEDAASLYKIDETIISDDERKALGVPTLTEARERAGRFK